ncbi:tetratricopeptide repeat-containing S1 family peptidase, partial [Phormidium sp. CCY1219]|uniref:tetratricopeptide repeat-containing S1 family peptidase n=1 Tax=Phormidium sp. CCY1219 TaxID=2886104 RepID=UPI002D1EEA4A
MMFSRKLFPAIIVGAAATVALVQPTPAFALDPSEIATQAKTFTVRIDGPQVGTGVIIDREDSTYTVLTNWHVVNRQGSYKITTADNRQHSLSYSQVRYLPNLDIAVVRFISSQSYATAEFGDSENLSEGKAVYVVGWSGQLPGIPERSYQFLDAKIVSRLQRGENGYELLHDNPSTPGTSGGPLLDDRARLVGINGRSTSEPNTNKAFGMAIPLQIFLAARSNLSPPPGIVTPEDDVARGEQLAKAGNYREAISAYNRVLAANPNHLDALYRRGEAYYRLEEFPPAIRDFNRLLQLNPNNAVVYFYRGYARQEQGEHQAALEDYNQAIRLDSNFAPAYHNRGFARRELGDLEAAIEDYNQAIRLDSNLALAYNNRGIARRELGDLEAA